MAVEAGGFLGDVTAVGKEGYFFEDAFVCGVEVESGLLEAGEEGGAVAGEDAVAVGGDLGGVGLECVDACAQVGLEVASFLRAHGGEMGEGGVEGCLEGGLGPGRVEGREVFAACAVQLGKAQEEVSVGVEGEVVGGGLPGEFGEGFPEGVGVPEEGVGGGVGGEGGLDLEGEFAACDVRADAGGEEVLKGGPFGRGGDVEFEGAAVDGAGFECHFGGAEGQGGASVSGH